MVSRALEKLVHSVLAAVASHSLRATPALIAVTSREVENGVKC